MLLSMTGFGDARRRVNELSVAAEVKSVNNRFLKCSIRLPDAYSPLEGELERAVRAKIARGTVNITIRVDRNQELGRFRLDTDMLKAYADQAHAVTIATNLPLAHLDALLGLPGVVTDRSTTIVDPVTDLPVIRDVLIEALEKLDEFRRVEGNSMSQELQANLETVETELNAVAAEAPEVVRDYRDRILQRVGDLLRDTNGKIAENDLIREVSLFADRSDINEEITRLRSHIAQFREFLEDETSQGRKLDFLTQELFREVNTIGSKANSTAIARRVVEMKACVEKIREILQNIE